MRPPKAVESELAHLKEEQKAGVTGRVHQLGLKKAVLTWWDRERLLMAVLTAWVHRSGQLTAAEKPWAHLKEE